MESDKTFRIIVIVTVSTLVTILSPVESKCVPLSDSFVARSLLPVFPPSNPPSQLESPSPAPAPANPPTEIDIDPPAASPDVPAGSVSPANSPTEIEMDSPSASPEAPADSISPTNVDIDSPAASPEAPAASPVPEAPADSISPTNPPAQENPVTPSTNAPSGTKLLSSPKSILKQPLLSPEIKTICGKTDFPPLCESSVSPLLTAQLKPDTSSVLVLAIQASINATKAAMATVDKAAAAECQELYDDAVTNLEDAVNAVKSRDIPTVNTNLSAAMTDYSTCNDGFEESGEPNPLADVGDKLTKMVSNCLAISTLIK